VTVVVTPRAGGIHIDARVDKVAALIAWEANLLFLHPHDVVDATVGALRLSADVDLEYDAAAKGLKPILRAHDLHVEDLQLDSAALGRSALADGLENAVSGAAEGLIQGFGDPILDVIQSRVVERMTLTLQRLALPEHVDLPFFNAAVDVAATIDGASFGASGLGLVLGAKVAPPAGTTVFPAALGTLTHPSGAPAFDETQLFSASIAVDFINQSIYALWAQGLLKRKLSGPINQFGLATGDIYGEPILPPVLLPSPDGRRFLLHVGELRVETVYHSPTQGDARVRVAISLVTGGDVILREDGSTIDVKPSHDPANTHLATELLAVEEGRAAAGEELAMVLAQFTGYIETVIAEEPQIPPIAIPRLDLAKLTPGFAGRVGHAVGGPRLDVSGARVGLAGRLVAD
jgi:hypothetical protein